MPSGSIELDELNDTVSGIWPEVGAAYRALLTQVAAGAQLAGNSQVARGAEISYEVPALVAHG